MSDIVLFLPRNKESNQNSASKYFRKIRYKGTLTPFTYCTLCKKVLGSKVNLTSHECIKAIEEMSRQDNEVVYVIQLFINL